MIDRQALGFIFPVKPLGQVVEFLDSRRRPVKESDRQPGPFPYYGANGQQGTINDYIFDERLVLLAEDGGFFDEPERGIAYRISGKTWVNNHAHVLRPRPGLDLNYLCRVLEHYDVRPYISGSTRSKLTKAQAEKIVIPLPPIREQRRIAAILDQADELRQKRRRSIAQLRKLEHAVFSDVFGDPVRNTKKWPIVEVGSVTDCIVPGRDKPKSFSGNTPWITTSELVHLGKTGLSEAKAGLTEDEIRQVRARVIPAKSVVLTCVGDLGIVSIADIPMVINQQLHAYQCSREVTPEYLMYSLSYQVHYMRRMATKTTLPYMNKSICNGIPIQLPPLSTQKIFSGRYNALSNIRQTLSRSLARLDSLFASLQHRVFNGELISKDAKRELAMTG